MIRSAVKVLPVALSITLAANCCLPCYTFAYADDLTDGGDRNVSAEEQEEIVGVSNGVEHSFGVGELSADDADGSAAGEGHGANLGAAERAIEDTTSGYGEVDSCVGSDVSTPGIDFGGIGVVANGNEDSSQFGVSSSDGNSSGIEEDSCSNGEKEVLDYLEDIVYLLGEIADYYRQGGSGVSPLATTDEVIVQRLISIDNGVNGLFTFSRGTSSNSSRVNWTLNGNNWNTTSTGLPWLLSWILTNVSTINAYTAQISQKSAYMESLYSLLGKQWGVGFGGTIVSYANSPYRFLQNLSDRTYFIRGSSSEGGYVNWSIRSNNWATPTTGLPWLLSFIAEILNGTNNNVIGIGNDLSASYVLDGETYSNKSLAQILAHLINVQYWEAFDIKRVKEYTSGLSTSMQLTGLPAGESTIAQIARYIYNNMVASYVIDGETYSNKSVAQMLAQVVNSSYWTSDKQSKIYDAFNTWAKSWDTFAKSSVDLSETNKLLGLLSADVAGIRDKFVLQDSLSDLLELLVGDLQVPQTQAAISRIQDVMSTRFPFCIPSVVNVVLFGSLLAEPAPPVWTFDVGGSPLVVDFADYGAFAEVSSWTVRLLFTAALLLNTRRFVYGVGGGY